MNKKIAIIAFAIISVTAIAVYSAISTLNNARQETNTLNFKIDTYTTIYDSQGNIKFYSEHPALLTNAGKELIEDVLGGGKTSEPTCDYIAVGGNTTALAVTDTTLANEFSTCGLTRATGTYASTGTGAWRLEKDFAVSGTCNSINSTGLFNASSTGALLAEDTITNTNVVNGDTLNITWTVSVS